MAKCLVRTLGRFLHVPKGPGIRQSSRLVNPHYARVTPETNPMRLPSFEEYMQEYRSGTFATRMTLVELLHLPGTCLISVIRDHPVLAKLSRREILQNYQTLVNLGVKREVIRANVDLLAYELDELMLKMSIVQKIDLAINDSVLLLKLPTKDLLEFLKRCEKDEENPASRIKTFAELLQADISSVCLHIVRCTPALFYNMNYLMRKMTLCLEAGFSKDEVLHDRWIFQYKYETLVKRIAFLKQNNIKLRKLWMLRLSECRVNKMVKNQHERTAFLGDNGTVADLIARKLKCDKIKAEYFVFKNPLVKTMNPHRISVILETLVEYGHNEYQILQCNIFKASIARIKTRLEIMRKIGILPSSALSYLSVSNSSFQKKIQLYIPKKRVGEDGHLCRF